MNERDESSGVCLASTIHTDLVGGGFSKAATRTPALGTPIAGAASSLTTYIL